MKNHSKSSLPPAHKPTEDEIRDYAFHLYQQSGCVPGRDVENWLEAKACLEANIPQKHSHSRLHRHRHASRSEPVGFATVATTELETVEPAETAADVIVEEILLVQPARKP